MMTRKSGEVSGGGDDEVSVYRVINHPRFPFRDGMGIGIPKERAHHHHFVEDTSFPAVQPPHN